MYSPPERMQAELSAVSAEQLRAARVDAGLGEKDLQHLNNDERVSVIFLIFLWRSRPDRPAGSECDCG